MMVERDAAFATITRYGSATSKWGGLTVSLIRATVGAR